MNLLIVVLVVLLIAFFPKLYTIWRILRTGWERIQMSKANIRNLLQNKMLILQQSDQICQTSINQENVIHETVADALTGNRLPQANQLLQQQENVIRSGPLFYGGGFPDPRTQDLLQEYMRQVQLLNTEISTEITKHDDLAFQYNTGKLNFPYMVIGIFYFKIKYFYPDGR